MGSGIQPGKNQRKKVVLLRGRQGGKGAAEIGDLLIDAVMAGAELLDETGKLGKIWFGSFGDAVLLTVDAGKGASQMGDEQRQNFHSNCKCSQAALAALCCAVFLFDPVPVPRHSASR